MLHRGGVVLHRRSLADNFFMCSDKNSNAYSTAISAVMQFAVL